MTIMEVMYDVGFNSVFNTAFKNKTGVTPSIKCVRIPKSEHKVLLLQLSLYRYK